MAVGEKIWFDGALNDREDCKVDILTHALHYGTGVFEGIRAYTQPDSKAGIFRLAEHSKRMLESCKTLGIKLDYNVDSISKACVDTVRANGFSECYVRPLAFVGAGPLGMALKKSPPIHLAIATWEWGSYLGEEGIKNGIRVKTSSYIRPHPNSVMTRAKISGNYASGILSKQEALSLGFDEALLLDANGFVAEGSGENIFMVRENKVFTPPRTCILPGITRDTVMTVLEKKGMKVQETSFTRDDLYSADEVFFTGTAAEVTPIRELDNRQIGAGTAGPLTKEIQKTYSDIVRGLNRDFHAAWVTKV